MRENRPSLTEATQTATNTQLESASTVVFEIRPTPTGTINPTYRNILLHHSLGFDFVNNELPLKIFVPHFEVDVFGKREFMIEFDEKTFIKFSGDELYQLQGPDPSTQLLNSRKSLVKEIQPIFEGNTTTDKHDLNQIVEEINATNPSPSTTNTMSNNQISPKSDNANEI